ncbi:MAG: hypothetical protein R3B72_34285 [Polyangiaceae bacterium]
MRWLGIGVTVVATVVAASCSLEVLDPVGVGGQGGGGVGGATSSSGSGASGGFSGETITVHVLTEDAVQMTPVPGVKICVEDVPLPCVTTDDQGEGDVQVPADARVWASLVLDGYVSALVGALTESEDLDLKAPMIRTQLASTIASTADVTLDPTRGHLGLVALRHPEKVGGSNTPQPDVGFSLSPSSGDGPLYVNTLNIPDPNLMKTGEAGGALWFNVEPGTPTLTAVHDSDPCGPFLAHPGPAPNTYELRVQPDYVTFVTIICGEEPMMGTGGAGGMGSGGAGGAGGMGSGGAGGMGSGGAGGMGGAG